MEVEATSVMAAEANDEEARLAAGGDRAAFASLYVRHRDTVFRYLRARCASDDDALELSAVTFERALTAMPRFRPQGGGVLAWLLRIARNAVIDQERRRRPLLPWSTAPEHPSLAPTPEQAVLGAEQRRELRGLLAELPQVQRDAIALRYAAGLTAREISLVINKSEEATQKLITRAVGRLKERMP